MQPDALFDKLEDILRQADCDETAADVLKDLRKLYEKQTRQLNSLTKLSDNTQAKLTDANATLEKLLRNLQRFVPSEVVRVLMAHGAEQVPTNSRETITVFFSDIVGFTSITERLDPERLAPLMTDYFTEMSDICSKWGGTLDQFIGDAIIIFFGAPHSKGIEEDAKSALSMAVEMQDRLKSLRAKWAQEGVTPDLNVRMGLSTGTCNVGNFGSHERLHYTAIGNAVNSAARIQSLAAPNHILLSEETYLLVRDHFKCDYDQTTLLHGQNHETKLYYAAQDQHKWHQQTLVASEDGYRFYFDPESVTNKDKVVSLLQDALATLEAEHHK